MRTFAFKLAGKTAGTDSKWMARDGVSLAACTYVGDGQYRWRDNGYYC
ncbi:MAG TPA: hypothetical protein VF645_06055 [Allosphingosinicella sp.]